ncbi:GC-rich sequence DNA-binding factor-like protein-domain-containing protein [Polychytrium aggregatum]|uniref:GC-rich sequence DNA-binding factor-like protein-domain-containing protein n=1 Tax=Polychytrium aggregatum TaxID=110093 RepID=UPI0022FDB246|nr:GC-rich sequence DNA-binding factor-like protein-domain-containing protein [Polychytrium aggregatum]KAI9202167.1 GC-rich sequence DNA-binding factor-like protein-domain-containing protein [Polychytrium aggregatum]
MQNIEFGSTRKPPKAPTQSKQPAPSSAPQASRQDIKKLESAYGIGFKLLSKQGYKVGQGLGMNSEGIAKPIDVKVLPKGAGLGRVDFQTETMKAEKRSKQQSDEAQDDDSAKATRDDKDAVSRSHDGWKRGSRRAKAQYKTAHEILLEQDGSPGDNAPSRPAAAPAVTKIIDMRGPEARVIVDASQIKSTSVPSVAATERIPELRYNMRLLVDLSQDQLMQLSKQLKLVKDARDQLQTKEARLKSVVAAEGSKIKRLEEVSKLAQDCQALSRQALVLVREGSDADPLKLFSPIFETLSSQYYEEYKAYNLDELVVASISPIIQAMTRMWSPLESPSTFVHHFKQWKQLLHTTSSSTPPQSQPKSRHLEADEIDHFGAATRFIQDSADSGNAKMTPYESLLYHIWLPKIRSAINNSWDVYEPEPLVQLLSAWCTGHYDQSASESDNGASATTIPRWLMDNIVDQLLMPKLSSAIDDWSPTKPSMHWWIHPWLPLLGDQLQPLLTPIRRRLEKSFGINSNGWHPSDPQGIANIKPWRGVLPDAEIDSMLVRAVLPKLIHTLRNELLVTPSEHQNMEPFAWVVAWHGTIPDALMARAFETEFFPKWLEALYRWLGHSTCDLEQVQQWYFAWKGSFPSTLLRHSGIEDSFKLALELISDQLDGSLSWKAVDAHLQRVLGEEPQPIPPVDTAAARRQRSAPDISFKEYAEKRAAENDLVFLPLHRKHESGKALFSLGPESAPRRLILFIDDGVVFVHEGGDLTSHSRWIPTSIDNAIDMASRQR